MPTELEELVEFLHHGNTQIRQIAAENLVGYSTAQPNLFKRNQLEPVKDLKLLIKDYPQIAKNASTILVNISEDAEVRENLIGDAEFLESLLRRVTDPKEPNANLHSMLLANLSKSPQITTNLLPLTRSPSLIPKPLSTSPRAIDQLLDCFVKGSDGTYNKHADYDYLSYLFADLAKSSTGRTYFLRPNPQDVDDVVPLMKIIVFTEHKSTIRRRGVANTIKNVCFDTASHSRLLASSNDEDINLLPYILLPLMGSESYSEEETDSLPLECQLLAPDKEREAEVDILATHLETLLLLSTGREGRAMLRAKSAYPVVREVHASVEDEGVREACDRLVQVLMRGEEGEGGEIVGERVEEIEGGEEDDDERIVKVL